MLERISPFVGIDTSLPQIQKMLELQAITCSDNDLTQIQQHFKIILSHAERVMALNIDEHIEPAPIFRPE